MKKIGIICTATVLSLIVFSNITFAESINKNKNYNETSHKHFQHKKDCERPKIKEYLNLSPEQTEQAKALRENSREKIKPLIENFKAERTKLKELKQQNASEEEIKAQIEKIKKTKVQLKEIREKNLAQFEAILTAEQKVKFKKFQEEQKAKRKANMSERRKTNSSQNQRRTVK